MSDKTWKACERKIAKWFPGAKRRGADFRGEHSGKSDLIYPGWSVEIKHSKRPTYGLMTSAVSQAETNRDRPDDIPVAVIHRTGDDYGDSLVVMRLEQFAQFFINNQD